METISIYPDKKLKNQIEKMAKKDNRSMNNFILIILNKYIKENESI